ncbi:hypothetical protein ACRAWD_00895 [Caulobacter segnis]
MTSLGLTSFTMGTNSIDMPASGSAAGAGDRALRGGRQRGLYRSAWGSIGTAITSTARPRPMNSSRSDLEHRAPDPGDRCGAYNSQIVCRSTSHRPDQRLRPAG